MHRRAPVLLSKHKQKREKKKHLHLLDQSFSHLPQSQGLGDIGIRGASLHGRQRLKASSVNGGGGCCRGVHLPFLSLASHGRQAHTTTQSPISNYYHTQSCRFHFSVFHSSTAKPFTFQPSCKSPSPQITVFRCHFNV